MQWDDELEARQKAGSGKSGAARVAQAKADLVALMQDRNMSFGEAFEVALMTNIAPVLPEEEAESPRGQYFARDVGDDDESVTTTADENPDL